MKKIQKILMLGDSLVEYGDWRKLLPGLSVINRGISGETLMELSVRLADEGLRREQRGRREQQRGERGHGANASPANVSRATPLK